MNRRWIVNASPLILLGKVGQLALLRDLSEVLVIPGAVAREVQAKPDGEKVIELVASFASVEIGSEIDIPSEVEVWDLGRGESQVLASAMGVRNGRVVVDDMEARRCARVLGISVIGTLGVVLRAKRHGLIKAARPLVTTLRRVGLYASDELIERALDYLHE